MIYQAVNLQALSYLILTAALYGRGGMIASILVKVTQQQQQMNPNLGRLIHNLFIFGYAAKFSLVFPVGWPGVIQRPSLTHGSQGCLRHLHPISQDGELVGAVELKVLWIL